MGGSEGHLQEPWLRGEVEDSMYRPSHTTARREKIQTKTRSKIWTHYPSSTSTPTPHVANEAEAKTNTPSAFGRCFFPHVTCFVTTLTSGPSGWGPARQWNVELEVSTPSARLWQVRVGVGADDAGRHAGGTWVSQVPRLTTRPPLTCRSSHEACWRRTPHLRHITIAVAIPLAFPSSSFLWVLPYLLISHFPPIPPDSHR